jgi:replicative DNA helicase
MLSLARARFTRGSAGEPLPAVFKALSGQGVHFRQGQLALIAAAPGVGKSLLSLTLAIRAGLPCLYFSADTDQATMTIRAAAMVSGWTTGDIEQALDAGMTETLDVQLHKWSHIQFDFKASPTATDVEEELKAFRQVYGDWPSLIVVDNISNLDNELNTDGFQSLEGTCDFLHELARETGACVVGLHHVTGDFDDGTKPPSLSSLRGKVSKVPELVLALHRIGGDSYEGNRSIGVSPVKNRTGKSDPSGGWFLPLAVDLERMAVTG